MESRESQSITSIRADQTVGSVLGGIVASVYIQSMTGTVVVKPTSPPDPPDRKTIVGYLEELKKKESNPARSPAMSEETFAKLKRQWDMPFRAHRAAEEAQPLEQIVEQALADNQRRNGYLRLVLLADPGMGKTPALQSLAKGTAIKTLQRKRAQDGADESSGYQLVVPIHVDLANLRRGQDLATSLSAGFNAIDANHRITPNQAIGLLNSKDYTCCLLLDDLDQLLSQQQMGGFQTLSQLMETYSEHRYVVSCRTSIYRQQLGFLDVLYLDELHPSEVIQIIGETDYKGLISASKQLAHNRTVLERFIRKGAAGLPQTKGSFLQDLIRERLNTAAQDETLQDLDETTIQGLLESLAFRMRVDRTHVYDERHLMMVTTDYLQEWRETTPWRRVANALNKHELLTHDQGNLWRFRDRCDEAYFAAAAVVNNQAPLDILFREISEYWWRDVFEILVGLHPDPQGLLMELIDRDIYVAANCFRHVPESAAQACAEALVDALIEAFWKESTARQLHIVERLGESDHPRAPEALLQILYREWSSPVLMAALKALYRWDMRQEELTGRRTEIVDADRRIQLSLAGQTCFVSSRLLDWCWSDRSDTDNEMLAFLDDPANPDRARALVALGLGVRNSSKALDHLKRILDATNTDDKIAWCVVEAVALITPHDKIYEWAKATACKSDTDDSTSQQRRARAVYLLGSIGAGAENKELLFHALTDEVNPTARGYAAISIARLDLIGAREKLERRIEEEAEPWVLHKLAEALGQVGTLESLPFLEKHRRSHQARTRWIAHRAILEILERNEFYYRS